MYIVSFYQHFKIYNWIIYKWHLKSFCLKILPDYFKNNTSFYAKNKKITERVNYHNYIRIFLNWNKPAMFYFGIKRIFKIKPTNDRNIFFLTFFKPCKRIKIVYKAEKSVKFYLSVPFDTINLNLHVIDFK